MIRKQYIKTDITASRDVFDFSIAVDDVMNSQHICNFGNIIPKKDIFESRPC